MGLLEKMEKQRTTQMASEKKEEQKKETAVSPMEKREKEYEEEEEPVDIYADMKDKLQIETVEIVNNNYGRMSTDDDREEMLKKVLEDIISKHNYKIPKSDKDLIIKDVCDEIIGLGPIQKLVDDPDVTEIMVNGAKNVYVEKKGKLQLSDVKFKDDAHVMIILNRIVTAVGRRVDESSPMVDARLLDGSRVNAIIPPLALSGPTITIRKFPSNPIKASDLIRFGSVSPKMMSFLEACVKGRLNVFVSGGTGSGKTTLLGVLSGFIPETERIITIEDAAELQLQQRHVVTLESRPANIEGIGAIPIRDLVRNALRMRPDRIVVGECRGGEALDMLQAMNTGHDGSLTTGHSNSPRDMMSRLETMVLMSGMEMPVRAIREQISSALNLVVQQSRLRDGSRKITSITEVVGMEGDTITLQDIFIFKQEGLDENGKVKGHFMATGVRPNFEEKLASSGVILKDDWFTS